MATRWSTEAGDQSFVQRKQQLEQARTEYLDLDAARRRKLADLYNSS